MKNALRETIVSSLLLKYGIVKMVKIQNSANNGVQNGRNKIIVQKWGRNKANNQWKTAQNVTTDLTLSYHAYIVPLNSYFISHFGSYYAASLNLNHVSNINIIFKEVCLLLPLFGIDYCDYLKVLMLF